jgi:hypothetical protein
MILFDLIRDIGNKRLTDSQNFENYRDILYVSGRGGSGISS